MNTATDTFEATTNLKYEFSTIIKRVFLAKVHYNDDVLVSDLDIDHPFIFIKDDKSFYMAPFLQVSIPCYKKYNENVVHTNIFNEIRDTIWMMYNRLYHIIENKFKLIVDNGFSYNIKLYKIGKYDSYNIPCAMIIFTNSDGISRYLVKYDSKDIYECPYNNKYNSINGYSCNSVNIDNITRERILEGNILPSHVLYFNIVNNLYIIIENKDKNKIHKAFKYSISRNDIEPINTFIDIDCYAHAINASNYNTMEYNNNSNKDYINVSSKLKSAINTTSKTIIDYIQPKFFKEYETILSNNISKALYNTIKHLNYHNYFGVQFDFKDSESFYILKQSFIFMQGKLYLPPYDLLDVSEEEFYKYRKDCKDGALNDGVDHFISWNLSFNLKHNKSHFAALTSKQFLYDFSRIPNLRYSTNVLSHKQFMRYVNKFPDNWCVKVYNALKLSTEYYFNDIMSYIINSNSVQDLINNINLLFKEKQQITDSLLISTNKKDYKNITKFKSIEDMIVEYTYYLNLPSTNTFSCIQLAFDPGEDHYY